MTPLATSPSARLVNSRMSVATWSLRLRPVWKAGTGLARDLGDPPLDGRVDILVGGHENKRALG